MSSSCSGVAVPTNADIAALVSSHGPATTFCFGAGVYHLTRPIVPKTGDVFQGKGAGISVIDASEEITSRFRRSGNFWVASREESLPVAGSPCQAAYPLCRNPNDIYYDGAPLSRVGSLQALGPRKFYYDPSAKQVWIGSTPSGHVVEAAILEHAWKGFGSGADNVRISGVTVQHVGGTAIEGPGSWQVDNAEVRWNHVNGIVGPLTVTNNYLHHNGQAGYEVNCQCPTSATPHRFSSNEVAFNNHGDYAGYATLYDASGMKFMQVGSIIVQNNSIHHNGGPGLWSDTNVINATYRNNRVFRNVGPGILVEVSYSHTLAANDIEHNSDAGILIANSGPGEVTGNSLRGNLIGIAETQINRGSGTLGYHAVKGVHVHDNTIYMTAPPQLTSNEPTNATGQGDGWSGLKNWDSSAGYYTSYNNTWERNTYYIDCERNPRPFIWLSGSIYNANLNWSQWQAAGNDTNGTYACLQAGPSPPAAVAIHLGPVVRSAIPRPGRKITLRSVAATDAGDMVKGGIVRCRVRVGRHRIRPVRASLSYGVTRCRFRVPGAAGRRVLRGTIRLNSHGLTAVRPFRMRVRQA
jgi:parallel beta-helix repeat protein